MDKNHQMWQDLGMDLETHDLLCEALPGAFGDVFMTMDDRPECMDYFNMVAADIHGIGRQRLLRGKYLCQMPLPRDPAKGRQKKKQPCSCRPPKKHPFRLWISYLCHENPPAPVISLIMGRMSEHPMYGIKSYHTRAAYANIRIHHFFYRERREKY